MNNSDFKVRTYTKSSLARLYNPEVSEASARRLLRMWIARNGELQKELHELHFSPQCRVLTPLQVKAIVKYLGEPG